MPTVEEIKELELGTGAVITADWYTKLVDALLEFRSEIDAIPFDAYGYVTSDLVPDVDQALNLGIETKYFLSSRIGYGYFKHEVVVGSKSGTARLLPTSIDIPVLTVDPSLKAGRMWTRGDLNELRWSPDGATVATVYPVPITPHELSDTTIHLGYLLRTQLEYPTVDVFFAYLASINKTTIVKTGYGGGIITIDSFADRAIEGLNLGYRITLYGRHIDANNFYGGFRYVPAPTEDLYIAKMVAGTWTVLGVDAIDIGYEPRLLKFSCSGTTLSLYMDDSLRVSVTDPDITEGRFGGLTYCFEQSPEGYGESLTFRLLSPSSSITRRVLAYFEVPLKGTGKENDPFKPALPELIKDNRNILAIPYSSIIPTRKGKPIHNTCIIRVFEQPDRDPKLKPLSECIETITKTPGCKKMRREEALKRILEMNEKLHIFDLISKTKPTIREIQEYIDHVETQREVKLDIPTAKRHIMESAGW